jgi:hypothetical protein
MAGALCVLLLIAFACTAPLRASAQVLLVLSDESSGYQSVADELRGGLKNLRDGRLRVDATVAGRVAAIDAPTFAAYELVVTVGLSAAHATVSREEGLAAPPRTLCLLIPRQSFEHLAAPKGRAAAGNFSAVFIDQPLGRQLDLLLLALPDKKRVGVILGPSSQELAADLRDEARKRALEITPARIEEASGLYGALQTLLPASDLLLMLPDPVAANADSVYGLLLTAYRAELPVIGFSEGLLNAGALLSLFSTARQQGRQGAEIAAHALMQNGALPPAQYPKYFTVRVNASVARSLGLHLPAQDALGKALEDRGDGEPAPGNVPAPGVRP